ncbi:MAG: hypothetical protein AABX96_00210 [Nanoarchaeota archaeon]
MVQQQEFVFDRNRLYHIGQENRLFYLGDGDEEHKFAMFDIPPREITTDEERRVIGLKFGSFRIVSDLLYPTREDYLRVEMRRLCSLEIVEYNEACRKIMKIYEQLKGARTN